MTHTYKHQNRYLARHWSDDGNRYADMPFKLERNWSIEVGVGEYRSRANKRHRHLWKNVLHSQDEFKIESTPKKPENVDWDIW